MDEADRCNRVALIDKGRILTTDSPAAITGAFDRPLVAIRAKDRYRALLALRGFPHAHTVFPFGETLHYTDARKDVPASQVAAEVQAFLAAAGFDTEAQPVPATIEDSFMERLA